SDGAEQELGERDDAHAREKCQWCRRHGVSLVLRRFPPRVATAIGCSMSAWSGSPFPTAPTWLVRVPTSGMEMRTVSPYFSVKSAGGTMDGPERSTKPTGNWM